MTAVSVTDDHSPLPRVATQYLLHVMDSPLPAARAFIALFQIFVSSHCMLMRRGMCIARGSGYCVPDFNRP
jgi:hypothetical protein